MSDLYVTLACLTKLGPAIYVIMLRECNYSLDIAAIVRLSQSLLGRAESQCACTASC